MFAVHPTGLGLMRNVTTSMAGTLLLASALVACAGKNDKQDSSAAMAPADTHSTATTTPATPSPAAALPATSIAQFRTAAHHDSTTVEACSASKQFGSGQSARWVHVEMVVSTAAGNTQYTDAETVITKDQAGQQLDTVGTASIDLDQQGPWTLSQATGVRAATQKGTPGKHTAVGLAKSPDLGPVTVNYPCPK